MRFGFNNIPTSIVGVRAPRLSDNNPVSGTTAVAADDDDLAPPIIFSESIIYYNIQTEMLINLTIKSLTSELSQWSSSLSLG
jgi:hypothetical protein